MAIHYKFDVLSALKQAGYSTYKIRKTALFPERVVQQFRAGTLASWASINRLCAVLHMQPGDILEYVAPPPGEDDDDPDGAD